MCIIISTLEIIKLNLFIVVVTTVTEGVNGCNIYVLGKLGVGNRTCYSTPSIVGVSCDSLSILVNESDYVTLQVLDEVVGNVVIKNTANRILVIVEENKSIAVPCLTENLSAVKSIFVLNLIYGFGSTNTISVVGISVVVKALKLASLFPSQVMTEVGGGVALTHYIIFEWKCQ